MKTIRAILARLMCCAICMAAPLALADIFQQCLTWPDGVSHYQDCYWYPTGGTGNYACTSTCYEVWRINAKYCNYTGSSCWTLYPTTYTYITYTGTCDPEACFCLEDWTATDWVSADNPC